MGILTATVLLAGCAESAPVDPTSRTSSASAQPPASEAAASVPPAGSAAAASPAPGQAGSIAIADPGRPFDAAAILEAMRESRRPGGVPDQIETEAVAEAVAARLWTVDGEPWTTMSAGASCGPLRCTLEIGGSRAGILGEDLWTFEVIVASDEVVVLDTDLRSIPPDTRGALDAIARLAEPVIEDLDLLLVSAAWVPPPDESAYLLSYRTGNEEGSCELEVRLVEATAEIEVDAAGC